MVLRVFNFFVVDGEEMGDLEKLEMFGRLCRLREVKVRIY